MSTPLQFAREQCANYENNGSCGGVGIRGDGSIYMFGRKAQCVLASKQRCQYFEECVLPVHPNLETAKGQVFAGHLDEVRRIYSRWVPGFNRQNRRKCIDCKRREVEKHKRLCYECAQKRKKASKQESQRRLRNEEKTPSKPPVNIGPNEGAPIVPAE